MNHQNLYQELAALACLGPYRAAQATEHYIALNEGPGKTFQLLSADGELDLLATQEEDGSIRITTPPGHSRSYITLPDPGDNDARTFGMGLANMVRYTASRQTAHLALQKASLPQRDINDTRMEEAINTWTSQMPATLANRILGLTRLQHFADRLRQLIDPQVYHLARDPTGRVTLNRYNRAVRSADALLQLKKTNPGLANWYIAENQRKPQTFNHPGEIVTEIKRRARKAGIEDRHWKTLVHMDPRNIQALTRRQTKRHLAATIINAWGDNQERPVPQAIRQAAFILQVCTYDQPTASPPKRVEHPITSRNRRRLHQLARAILKQNPADPDSDGETTDHQANIAIKDYAAHQLATDQDITPTTYPGLMKAAQRWHQEEQQAQLAREAQEAIDRNNGWFQCWNSLVDHLDIVNPQNPGGPPIRAIPLTTGHELIAESRTMAHCVANYAATCAGGRSRIFSLRQGNITLATTQLICTQNTWRVNQTQGQANHPPGEPANQAAARLAQAYQEKWDTSPEPRHIQWQQNLHTSATRPTPQA